jgi:dTDP-4-dehydrorhamnose reductase
MSNILVTGAGGLLGAYLVPLLAQSGHTVVAHSLQSKGTIHADLTCMDQTVDLIRKVQPDVIVNLVAMTNVDTCETNPDLAYRLNMLSVLHLVNSIKMASPGCYLVHFSTDMVYDGNGPHGEDQARILNTYAMTKRASELIADSVDCAVLRSNFFGRSKTSGRQSLTDWIYQSLRSGTSIKVFEDVYFSPLSIPTLCKMIEALIRKRACGLFNLGASDGMSKAEFAFAFADRLGLPVNLLERCQVRSAGIFPTMRPTDMRMNCSRFEAEMQLTLPSLLDEINLIGSQYHD